MAFPKKAKKSGKKTVKHVDGEENFRFALNAAVLAVLIGLLLMLVSNLTTSLGMMSKAAGM